MKIEHPQGLLLDAKGRVVKRFANWSIGEHEVDDVVDSVKYVESINENTKDIHWRYKEYNSGAESTSIPTLSEAKSDKINEIKNHANAVLSETDWYITREQETGKPISQDVLDHRSQVRSDSDTFEKEVNNLETVEEVLNYEYSFPDPPQ